MSVETRKDAIEAIKSILKDQALEDFTRNTRSEDPSFKDKEVRVLWEQCSDLFTKIWLSYMPDRQLKEMLMKKMIVGKYAPHQKGTFRSP